MSNGDPVETAVAWAEVHGKFDRMIQLIDTVRDKQEEMAEDVAKIKEAVYNPESGLYARLRALESWKENSSRILWLVITSVLSLLAVTVYKALQ
tara:strand:+ start:757 stop:1038 length:282 start_codon:yes stop_codon:yes gene_type:complete